MPQNKECALGSQLVVASYWGVSTEAIAALMLIFTWQTTLQTTKTVGSGLFDLAFLDHSDAFHECSRPLGSDVRSTEGTFMSSNLSLCEEKQFEDQVLQPEWAWDSAKYMDLYVFNVTNPGLAAGGAKVALQELAPLFLSSKSNPGSPSGTVTVNRDDLDTDGRLSYKILRTWRYRTDLMKHQRTNFHDEVVIPHYVFAAMLHNGLSVADTTSTSVRSAYNSENLPSYYPLFVKVKISDLLGISAYSATDPVTDGRSDVPFTLDVLDGEPTETSYFVSSKQGVQGFGFIRYAWNGQDVHCGYDSDCGDTNSLSARSKIFQLSKEKAIETSRSCTAAGSCNPASLQKGNNGIPFGVTGFKHVPSASFFEIPQVTGELWDYQSYSKPGTLWTGLNTAYFFLYDVKLEQETKYMRIRSHLWSHSKFHRRTENCDAQTAGDSQGLDCSSKESTIHIGASRDALRPGPLYFSQADANAPTEADLDITTCESNHGDVLECKRPLKNNFQMLTDALTGTRICHRESAQISLQMQKNTAFSNSNTLVPLAWKKDHMCLTGGKLYYMMRIDMTQHRVLPYMMWSVATLVVTLGVLAMTLRGMMKFRQVDTTSFLGDKPCV